ncbi:MAG: TonB-dependent receptor, partial [Bacteroidota bacterium]
MKKTSTFFWCLLCFPLALFGQRPSYGPGGGGASKAKIPVKGIILDAESQTPLEFATVTLFAQSDSSVVTGGIADAKGQFRLEGRPGRFYAKIEFISYQSQWIDNIRIEKGSLAKDLGNISLIMDAATLLEVEVRAEKSQMQMSLDKKVFNVGKDLANRGGSAADILDNVPSVTVDIEGNVELRGSGNVRILVDGKPSGLIGVDNANGLQQLPANLIERVEVITNPSARYEAEGMAGIINIVLRKDKKTGLNGSFDFTAGHPDEYGTAINLNLRKNNFNFFTNYGINYRRSPGNGTRSQIFNLLSDTSQISDQVRSFDRGGWSNSIRLGADYFFNEKNILTSSFLYKVGRDRNSSALEYQDFTQIGEQSPSLIGITDRSEEEKENDSTLEYALNYKKNFDRKGQVFTADLTYRDNTETESSDFTNILLNPDRSLTGLPNEQQRSSNEESEDQLRLQIDYVHPFSKDNKLEIGGLSSIRNISNNYLVEEFFGERWNKIQGLSDDFRYDEDIHALYASYSNKINKLSYQVGIRGEYSKVVTESSVSDPTPRDSINDRNYINPFPSVFVAYELPNQHSVQISYSRRIGRPRFWDLNPFFTFGDERNFFGGNPNLDPEYTNSFELSHIKYFDKGSLTSAIYYRHTTDVIQRIRQFNSDGTTATRPENLATQDDWGLELTYSISPKKWWRFNGNFNFFRSITEGDEFGRADTYTWFGRINNKMTLWKGLDFQTTFNYRAPRETPQGSRRSIWSINLGLSKDIFQKKGALTLGIRDLFNTRKRRWTIDQPDFFEEGD